MGELPLIASHPLAKDGIGRTMPDTQRAPASVRPLEIAQDWVTHVDCSSALVAALWIAY